MGPIQPLGSEHSGWFDRVSRLGNSSPASGSNSQAVGQSAPLAGGQMASMLSMTNSISQMLSSIGGGAQNNQMLEMMIALLIIMSMLGQQRGGDAGMDALGKLGGGASSSTFSYSSTTISTQFTSLQYTQVNINQVNKSIGAPKASGFDAVA